MTSITPFLWFDNNVPEAVALASGIPCSAPTFERLGLVDQKARDTQLPPRSPTRHPRYCWPINMSTYCVGPFPYKEQGRGESRPLLDTHPMSALTRDKRTSHIRK
jgi:hypothetical protein